MPSAPPALVAEIATAAERIAADPGKSGPVWGAAHKAMLKAKIDPALAARLIASRDLDGLHALVRTLRGESSPDARPDAHPDARPDAPELQPTPAATPTAAAIDPAEKKAALRAFRKRLKLTRLDHESRLGVGPLTGGRAHDVDAILPPGDFAPAVWRALAAEGRLRDVGRGFYALAEEVH